MPPHSIRPAAVAGSFYPADRDELARTLRALLAAVPPSSVSFGPAALIVPHAGYVYSGPVAAHGYAALAPLRDRIRRVILLGPSHYVPLAGCALPDTTAFATPLGVVPVDTVAVASIARLPGVRTDALAHRDEHSLEVQLPFLQTTLDDFALVPLAVGDVPATALADVLDALAPAPDALVVVSSDLSHYLTYERARAIDHTTAEAVLALAPPPLAPPRACGAVPIDGLLEFARRHDLRPTLLDLRNSGDTAGGRERVVGYGAFRFDAA